MYSRKQSQHLYLILKVLHFLSSCPYLHWLLWISSESLLTRFDNGLAINFALSINCSLKDIFVISSRILSVILNSFSIGTIKVMDFEVFSPKQVSCFSNFSANSFMIKLYSWLDQLWKAIRIFLGTLYLKLHVLCAAPLYSFV